MIKSTLKLKIIIFLLCILCLESNIQAQWFETGNNLFQTGIFGSTSNFDVLFRTDNVNRMRLMETSTYNVDGYNIDNSGFLYLGLTPSALTGFEAQSALHIDGTNNFSGSPQGQGFRDCLPADF